MAGQTKILFVILAVAGLLSGCESSPEWRAATACEAAAIERSEGKLLAVDVGALEASARMESGGVMQLLGPVTFDTGLPSEYSQSLNCRVQFVGNDAKVIGLSFVF